MACRILEIRGKKRSFLGFFPCVWNAVPCPREEKGCERGTVSRPALLLLPLEWMWLSEAGGPQRRRSRDNRLDLSMTPLINIESLSSLITVQTCRGGGTQPACLPASASVWHDTEFLGCSGDSLRERQEYVRKREKKRKRKIRDSKLHLHVVTAIIHWLMIYFCRKRR